MDMPPKVVFQDIEVSKIKDKRDEITVKVTSDVTCNNQMTEVLCIVAHIFYRICHNDF